MAGTTMKQAGLALTELARQIRTHFEISPAEREDEARRDAHDDAQDPWGYDDPPQEPREEGSSDG